MQSLMKRTSFLDSSLRLDGILDILIILEKQSIHFSKLFRESRIQFKKSFLKYARHCVEMGYVEKYTPRTDEIDVYRGEYGMVFYKITPKGRQFLELTK